MTDHHETAAIECVDVVKRFRAGDGWLTAVDGVSLRIDAGGMTALTGPSGSGKSTLLHLIGAIEKADSGSILVNDAEVTTLGRTGLTAYRRSIGFVFQRYHLIAALTALDNVIAPVLPYRTAYNKTARARELLATVGLAGREEALPARLSGGEQQRVAIARALMGSPRVLLADEPTGNLDSQSGDAVLDLLDDLRRDHRMTVLIATHERQVVERCDRVIRLRDGALAEASAGQDRPASQAHSVVPWQAP
ncbi:putative ABC transport system ATP-binding protein [Asanoa hainanensis]|uniref:Putative ABC transport system ATP-binding protein n=1 Tax=Asanoa hainanensis TaxID=560556 RepID=A0A239PES4_9ACTN|nr:ABC transporter ATP-binding protein [Asanoa hainanensis]SNT65483.1 putative ABC transport system ATP-binding protein [Asanoa hainanensis]